jgi:sugar phosphate isomerase/epimerase
MSRLGIELLSVFGLNPVEHVRLAADLGCGHVSTGLTMAPWNPHGYATWSLKEDSALRREMVRAMREHSVTISLGEGFGIRPGRDVRDRDEDIDIMAELGARGLGAINMEPDVERARDQLAQLTEMAAACGLLTTLEFAPGQPGGSLPEALATVRYVDQPHFRLNLDAMHFFRSGGTVADIAALDPSLIGYAQLCDVPLTPVEPDYMREAMFERRAPGQGELPLAEFVASLPKDIPIGLEVPDLARAEAGVPPIERLRPAVEATLRLLK